MREGKQTVIITGSSGLIGSRLIETAPDEFQIAGFDNHGPPEPPILAECVPVDLTVDQGVTRALQRVRHAYGERIASVIHLAAYYDFSGEESSLYEDLTIRGTERLLRALHDAKMQVEQFIFSSTMLVHAPCEPGQAIDHTWPLQPKWAYPKSKVAAEETIARNRGSIPSVILRIAGVYNDRCNSLPLSHQMQRIYERRMTSRVFPGDTSRGQSMVHLDDLTDLIWRAVVRRKELSAQTTLVVGEPETLSYDELQHAFGRLIHGEQKWETTQIPKTVAKTGAWFQDNIPGMEEPFIKPWMIDLADDHYAVNIERSRELLGWMPRHGLRESLPEMVRALKTDPKEFYKRHGLPGEPPDSAPGHEPGSGS